MKILHQEPPREFLVGFENKVSLKHCAQIELESDELVTFANVSGSEYDVVRKEWGYYATPSLNKRLLSFQLRPVLTQNREGHFFLLLVERGKEGLFEKYVSSEKLKLILWFDDMRALAELASRTATS